MRLAIAVLVAGALAEGPARAQEKGSAEQPYVPDEAGDAPTTIKDDPDRPKLKLKGGETPLSREPGDVALRPGGEAAPASYQGVTPGGQNLPPKAPKLPVKGPQRLTWPGFQVVAGVPTVFLELTGPVEWTVSESPGRLVYTLKGTTIHLRNNQRALKVAEFGTVVKEIDARPKGKDVRVTINVKQKVGHRERTADAAGGFKMLVVELSPQ
jgi:hypothetical protein